MSYKSVNNRQKTLSLILNTRWVGLGGSYLSPSCWTTRREKHIEMLSDTGSATCLCKAGGLQLNTTSNCSPPIQAPKTPQQFQSQLLCQDASFTFGYDDLRRQILILSLRL